MVDDEKLNRDMYEIQRCEIVDSTEKYWRNKFSHMSRDEKIDFFIKKAEERYIQDCVDAIVHI